MWSGTGSLSSASLWAPLYHSGADSLVLALPHRLIQACASLAVDCAVRREGGVMGHDEDHGELLRACEFPRIAGHKPFDTSASWFLEMQAPVATPTPPTRNPFPAHLNGSLAGFSETTHAVIPNFLAIRRAIAIPILTSEQKDIAVYGTDASAGKRDPPAKRAKIRYPPPLLPLMPW